jgi:hypothetical protein
MVSAALGQDAPGRQAITALGGWGVSIEATAASGVA